MKQIIGWAAEVAANLPGAFTVTEATNATPIVVVTSAPHGLNVGEIIAVTGVVGNLAANGVFVAGAVTGTTVALTAFPGGADVAGTGNYISGGSLQSLGFGVTTPIPTDLNDPMFAESVNCAFEALLAQTAYLNYAFTNYLQLAGGIVSGLLSAQGGIRYRPRVVLSDAIHTISVDADSYVLPNAPAATRLITLSTTVGSPVTGQRIRVTVSNFQGGPTPQTYEFTRTGVPAGLLASVWSSSVVTSGMPIFLEFEYAEGLVLTVTGTSSGSGSAVKLALAVPSGALGSATDTLATGDSCVVAAVGGTTEADGTWAITVNDATHITLTGTTFANAWTSGGTVRITPGNWRLAASSGTAYDGVSQYGVLTGAGS